MDQTSKPSILLASQSPRRAMLLREAGYSFEVHSSQAEELDANHLNIDDIVRENAAIKGREVLNRVQNGNLESSATLLLAADTLVVAGAKVYGKPRDLAQAEQFLDELGGIPHQVKTGVFLHHLAKNQSVFFLENTSVVLKIMTRDEKYRLFEKVSPLDKAAAYGFQDAPEIVTRLEGSKTNVIGLPMERLSLEIDRLCLVD